MVATHRAGQAGLAGHVQAAQRHLGGVVELGQLEQRVAFDDGQPHQGRAVPCRLGQRLPPLQEGEPLLDLPAHERVVREAGQDAGDQRGGAGRFGDLQRPVQREALVFSRPSADSRKMLA